MELIEENAQGDLQELVKDRNVNLQTLVGNFDPTPANMRNFLMPKRGENPVGSLASGLQLGGLLLLIPNLPLGLAAIGLGQATRILGKQEIETSDKKAIAAAAIESAKELEKQIKQQVDEQFAQLTEQLKTGIQDLYEDRIAQIRKF